MTIKAVSIDKDLGLRWLTSSLTQGFDLSVAAKGVVESRHGKFHSFISSEHETYRTNFAEGGMARTGGSMEALAQYLDGLVSRHAKCVIVENDLWRRTDPLVDAGTKSPYAFVDDRVIHWCDLKNQNGTQCVDVINRGASGYPLNAFVSGKSSSALGLMDRQQVPQNLANEVAESLLAVIVAAFDAETFMVWTPG